LRVSKQGLEIRRHYETQAKTVRVEKQNKLDKLKTELAQSQQMEKDLQGESTLGLPLAIFLP
jgi:hypothetical protein